MSKRLILMRHAKSSRDDPSIGDFDRPLSYRGRRAAPLMGQFLAKQQKQPQAVLCSSAKRAVETWDLIAPFLTPKSKTQFARSLYLAMPREMLKHIHALPDDIDCALLVGHNPGIADLAAWLCGEGDGKARTALAKKFPTAAVAIIDFDVANWKDVDAEGGKLIGFAAPKQMTAKAA